jgi:spermidine/putrescine transport system permease protein
MAAPSSFLPRGRGFVGDLLLRLGAAIVMVFLYAPIVVLVLFSFNAEQSLNFPISGLTLRWYREAILDPSLAVGFQNSIRIGALTALISTVLGTAGAFGMARRDFRGKGVIKNLMIVPMTIPTLLLGVSLLIFYHRVGIPRSMWTVVIGHITFTLPFVLVIVTSRLAGFDVHLEEAARDLGATPFQTFLHITLPLISPAVLAGGLMAFTLSFDDFIVAFLTTGTETTLPIQIWSMLRFGLSLKVNALATLILAFSLSMLALAVLTMRRSPIRRGRAGERRAGSASGGRDSERAASG